MPQNFTQTFQYVIKCFYILEMPHMHVLWHLQVRLKIACRMGDLLAQNNIMFDVPNGLVMVIF